MPIKDYSTTAGSNTSVAGINIAEGCPAANVNNGMRAIMADTRSFYEAPTWTDLGHTPTRTGNTTFTINADVASYYTAGRRIRCTDSSTLYGTIASAVYSSPNTTVTVTLDSGNLSASLTAVALAVIDPTGDPIDVASLAGVVPAGNLPASIVNGVVFTGMLAPCALTAAPAGWLLCFGQAVSRTTYANLFSAIGTTYGTGDGATTFNLPDLRGRTLFGLDNMGGSDAGRLSVSNTLGGTGGAQTKSGSVDGTALTTAQMPNHTHGQTLGSLPMIRSGSGGSSVLGNVVQTSTTGTDTQCITNSAGSGDTHTHTFTNVDVLNPYMLINWIIKD